MKPFGKGFSQSRILEQSSWNDFVSRSGARRRRRLNECLLVRCRGALFRHVAAGAMIGMVGTKVWRWRTGRWPERASRGLWVSPWVGKRRLDFRGVVGGGGGDIWFGGFIIHGGVSGGVANTRVWLLLLFRGVHHQGCTTFVVGIVHNDNIIVILTSILHVVVVGIPQWNSSSSIIIIPISIHPSSGGKQAHRAQF